jgi:hypothetical protein
LVIAKVQDSVRYSHLHIPFIMKTHLFRSAMLLLVGASLALTSCEYPYYQNGYYGSGSGYNQRTGTVYGAAGGALLGGIIGNQSRRPLEGALIGGILGGLAGNAIGANRDRYYYVRGGPAYDNRYTNRYYYGRPSYSSSYYRHPYFSNSYYGSPYYSRRPTYVSRYSYRPWGGGYGFGQPFGWGTGFGLGSRWY